MDMTTNSKNCTRQRLFCRALAAACQLNALVCTVMAIGSMLVVAAAITAGYRPVVITGDTMGQAAPAGSLVIAGPTGEVAVGDLLVMRRQDRSTITHRVIEVEQHNDRSFAITKGDASAKPDAAPYNLGPEELVSKAVIPRVGVVFLALADPVSVLISILIAVTIVSSWLVHRIWGRSGELPDPSENKGATAITADGPRSVGSPDGRGRPHRRTWGRKVALVAMAALTSAIGTVAGALYHSNAPVPANIFATPQCFDAQLGSVQNGQAVSSGNGVQPITISAVDLASSFLITSTQSMSNEPADSMVQARLSDATTIELTRRTDAGPSPVIVEWSVVEYSCGVSVQRGVTAGNDGTQLDVPIAAIDTAAAFSLVSMVGAASDADFDGSSMAIAELIGPATLRLRTLAPSTIPSGSSYAWQVVSFDDPTDVAVQSISTNLGAGSSATLPIAATDPATTLVLATVATGSSGSDIDERMVRAHLASATSIDVDRSGGGDPVEVHVQVVELRDGSTVQHGTVDFSIGQNARTIDIDSIDPLRSVALSTVQVPGSQSGGLTAMIADDIVGEASATFDITDPTTVTVTRDASTATASFGWQAVQWGGPGWWDSAYTFRQRIDVTAGSAAAPEGYSVATVIDHAALVTSGLSLADGTDLRVLRWDGTSWTELDRVLHDAKSWDAVDTTFWFRTEDRVETSATDSYWLYFGNAAPPAPLDDAENVWLLSEDFESGTIGDFEDRTGGTSWYSADPWVRRIQLAIAPGATDADLSEFTVLVAVTSTDLAANAQADGSDIRFTESDGSTTLPHEIEVWNSATGELTAWVRLPSLPSGSSTTMFLYYGAADAPSMANPRATWSSAVVGAWHLARDPAGTGPQADDSTIFNHDGVSVGTMTGADLVTGLVGPAVDFDGVDDQLDIGTWDFGSYNELTASGWVNLDSTAGEGRIMAKASGPAARVFELGHNGAAARARLAIGGATIEVSGGSLTTGVWHQLVAVWDGWSLQLYVDGLPVGSAPAYGVIDSDPTMPVTIGALSSGGGAIDGRVDELRLESTARSAAWIGAAEDNQRSPESFVTAMSSTGGSWFDHGVWSFRKPIVIEADQIDSTLTDHPALIQVTDGELAASAQVGGSDIVFTAADGLTRLDHEIERWDFGSGALTAWVRVPVLDGTADTTIFVYYGNGTAADQQDAAAVFGDSGDLIAHLDG